MMPSDSRASTPEPAPASNVSRAGPLARGQAPDWHLGAVAVTAGLVAGVVAWLAGETRAVIVPPAHQETNLMGSGHFVPIHTPEASLAATRQTATRAFGVLGALTGLLLGLAGGWAAGSGRRALGASGLGLIVGGGVGAGVAWVVLPGFESWRVANAGALLPALLSHGACWVPIGAVGGLALALGSRGSALGGLAGGALGATLATVLHEVLGAFLFPMAETGEPVSATWATRLLARLLVPTLAAAGAALSTSRRGRPVTAAA
jgi:hypothetical protein